MIIGIGTDIIEVARVERAIAKEEFLRKVFSPREIDYCSKQNNAMSYAARFAAKEAFFKALGTGWREGMSILEVEILNNEIGKPDIHLSGRALEVFSNRGGKNVHVSISHLKEMAAAFVVVEG
ncbi:MAG: holo-ACP synthase [Chitinophagales bacterium]